MLTRGKRKAENKASWQNGADPDENSSGVFFREPTRRQQLVAKNTKYCHKKRTGDVWNRRDKAVGFDVKLEHIFQVAGYLCHK